LSQERKKEDEITIASLGYLLLVVNKNSTLKENKKEKVAFAAPQSLIDSWLSAPALGLLLT